MPRARAWFGTAAGAAVREGERAIVARMTDNIFGYRLLLLDGAFMEDGLADCPIRHRIRVARTPDGGEAEYVRGDARQLPLLRDSIDAVVMPHTLDFSADPHQILREVERVLIAEGRVVIIGFNPISLWGLWRLFLRWRGKVPWCGHFLTYRRMQDWLSLLGFDIERTDVCAFLPPVGRDGGRGKLAWLERIGYRVWPMLAGVYAVRAVKRVSTVRPVGRVWRPMRPLRPRTMEPTAREARDV